MERDITENNLIEDADVFADIVNVNLFDGDNEVAEKDIRSMPTVSSYKDLDGTLHKQIRDVLKLVYNLGGCIALIGCESQQDINRIMPVRDMGYTYTAYMKQIQDKTAENRKNKNSAYTKVLHENQKLMPVATFILYFGDEKWEKPLKLMDILDIPEDKTDFWKRLINDYPIRVISVADQPETVRDKYKSDFRIIADYMALRNDKAKIKEYFKNNDHELMHVEHVLDLLHALSGDSRFYTIRQKYEDMEESKKGESKKMCLLLDAIEEEGIEKGFQKGMKQGMKQGVKQGIKQGSDQITNTIVERMIKANEPIQKIIEYTGISKDALEKLMN